MSKKKSVQLNRSKSLTDIDSELDDAMELLDDSNKNIDDLLHSFEELSPGGESSTEPESMTDSTDEAASEMDSEKSED